MVDDGSQSWEDRCNRYFSSISDTDKDRDQEKHFRSTRALTNKSSEQNNDVTDHDNDERDHDVHAMSSTDLPWKNLSEVRKTTTENQILRHIRAVLSVWDVHGSRIGSRTNTPVEMIVWLIVTLLGVGVTIYFGYVFIKDYKNEGLVYQIKKVSESKELNDESRPVCTLCNLNLLKKASVETSSHVSLKDIFAKRFLQEQMSISVEQVINDNFNLITKLQNELDDSFQSFIETLRKDVLIKEMTTNSNVSLVDRLISFSKPDLLLDAMVITNKDAQTMGHRVEDMIVDCWVDNRRCEDKDYDGYSSPSLGRCITFKPQSPPGQIEVTLDAEADQYIPFLSQSVGFVLMIHDESTEPVFGRMVRISPGKHSFLTVDQMTVVKRQESDCSSKFSSKQMCYYTCQMDLVKELCGCVDDSCEAFMPSKYICKEVIQKLIKLKPDVCECHEPCLGHSYSLKMHTIDWPSLTFTESVQSLLKQNRNADSMMNTTVIRNNIAKVTLDLGANVVTTFEERSYHTLLHLLAGLGGIAAIASGLSVMSVLEFVYIVIKAIISAISFCCKRSNANLSPQRLTDSEITSITWAMHRQRRRLEEMNKLNNASTPNNHPGHQNHVSALRGNAFTRISKRNSYQSSGDLLHQSSNQTNHQQTHTNDSVDDHPYQRRNSSQNWNQSRNRNSHSDYTRESQEPLGFMRNKSGRHGQYEISVIKSPQQVSDYSNTYSNTQALYESHHHKGSLDDRLSPVKEGASTLESAHNSRLHTAEGVQFYNGTSAYFTSNNISEPVYL